MCFHKEPRKESQSLPWFKGRLFVSSFLHHVWQRGCLSSSASGSFLNSEVSEATMMSLLLKTTVGWDNEDLFIQALSFSWHTFPVFLQIQMYPMCWKGCHIFIYLLHYWKGSIQQYVSLPLKHIIFIFSQKVLLD